MSRFEGFSSKRSISIIPKLYDEITVGDYLSLKVIGFVQIKNKVVIETKKEWQYYFEWKMPYGTLAGGITRVEEFTSIKTEPLIFRMLGFEQKRNPYVYKTHIPYYYYYPVKKIQIWTNNEGNEFHFTENKQFWDKKHNQLHLLQQLVRGRYKFDLKLKQDYQLNYNDIYLFSDETN
jgi:hypothetical protein